MQRQSFIALVAAFGLLTSAPLAQAKNHLKKPLIERIDGALAKAKRTRECGGLIVFAPRQFALNISQTLATSTMQPIVPTPTMTLPFSKKR